MMHQATLLQSFARSDRSHLHVWNDSGGEVSDVEKQWVTGVGAIQSGARGLGEGKSSEHLREGSKGYLRYLGQNRALTSSG